jgi:predicted phosphodiesterase
MMDNFDEDILKSIKKRKKDSEDYSEIYDRLFGIDISKDEARKRLKGIENYLEHKKKDLKEDEIEKTFTDEEELEYLQLAEEYTKLKKKFQNMQDKLRIERKFIRKQSREDNMRDVLTDTLDKVDKYNFKNYQPIKDNVYAEMIIQLSDLHCGQFIEGKYNYEIMEERLIKYFSKAIQIASEKSIPTITIAFTGDIFNLDHVMDKLLMNEEVRAESLRRGFEIISGCIDMLLENNFSIKLIGVLGNESRVNSHEYMSNVTRLAVDSFDYMLFILLHTRYSERITFLNMCNEIEALFVVNDKVIALAHGHRLKHNQLGKEVASMKLRLFQDKGIMMDYLLFGHIHQTLITPFCARSGSLVGEDEYSSVGLNIPMSRASQNIIIVNNDIEVTPINLD